jgi:UDP-glucose 4-epimerase
MSDPRRYFEVNMVGGIKLLNSMLRNDCCKLIFSSSAAVYGEPKAIPVEEDHPRNPVNAYGESKLMFERILEWYRRAYGLRYISLRYFNAAGASELLGEDHRPETHLIPNVLKAALTGSPVPIFGTDYPTKDGSCIRDYIHVVDIARAHVLALQKLDSQAPSPKSPEPEYRALEIGPRVYNLGNGDGYSVLEVIKAARKVTGVHIPTKLCPRRPGDPAVLVASSKRAKAELGWTPKFHELEAIIESAWRWMREHRNGYGQSG